MGDEVKPIIDDGWVENVYALVVDMEVELDGNPILYGPGRMNEKIAQTRKHLSRLELLSIDLMKLLRQLNRELRGCEATFEMRRADLLANDPDIRDGRSIRDRDAMVSLRLKKDVDHIQSLKDSLLELDYVEKVLKNRRADLKDCQGRIRDQIKLCQEQISLGGSWGSARPPEKGRIKTEKGSAMDALENAKSQEDLEDAFDSVEVAFQQVSGSTETSEETVSHEMTGMDLLNAADSSFDLDALLEAGEQSSGDAVVIKEEKSSPAKKESNVLAGFTVENTSNVDSFLNSSLDDEESTSNTEDAFSLDDFIDAL